MLCYILHKTPIWKNVSPGKRNVRILCLGLVLYLFLHALAYEFKDGNFWGKFFYGYFIYFIVADLFLCGIEYKLHYGRSIMKELNPYEKDIYDEETHTYIPNNFDPTFDQALDPTVDPTFDPTFDPAFDPNLNMDINMNPDMDNVDTNNLINDNDSKSSSKK